MKRKGPPRKWDFTAMAVLETRLIENAPKRFSDHVSRYAPAGYRFTTKRTPKGTLLTRYE